jgi:Ni/Co efflux regulator RcnB
MKKFLSMLLAGMFAVSPMVMAAEKKMEHKPVHKKMVHKKWHKRVVHRKWHKKVEHKK